MPPPQPPQQSPYMTLPSQSENSLENVQDKLMISRLFAISPSCSFLPQNSIFCKTQSAEILSSA